MDKNSGYILLAGVAAFLLLSQKGGGNGEETGKYGTKSNLARMILDKFGNPQSPDYRPLFDASFQGLMMLPYATLALIYEGKIN